MNAPWRAAAIEAWYESQDHVGQADTDPEPYVAAAADAAAAAALRDVFAVLTENGYGRTEAYEDAVQHVRSQLATLGAPS